MKGKAALFGELTLDHNQTESGEYVGPGGAVYFAAKTFENLDIHPTIISSYGEDFPKKYLSKTVFIPGRANLDRTLIFQNITVEVGNRIQKVGNYKQLINKKMPDWQKVLAYDQDIVMVAPILPGLTKTKIELITRYFKRSLKLLSPQGFFRRITSGGTVESSNWQQAEQIIPLFDAVIASDKDFPKTPEIAAIWSQKGPLVIITREDKGCNIYRNGEVEEVSAFQAEKIKDSTGCGDIFAAAFAFSFIQSRDATSSAIFANAAACLSLRHLPNDLNYTYQDISSLVNQRRRLTYEYYH